jgi:hypothetical protein
MIAPGPADPSLQPQADRSCCKRAMARGSWTRAFADGDGVVPFLGGAVRCPNATLKYWSLHL